MEEIISYWSVADCPIVFACSYQQEGFSVQRLDSEVEGTQRGGQLQQPGCYDPLQEHGPVWQPSTNSTLTSCAHSQSEIMFYFFWWNPSTLTTARTRRNMFSGCPSCLTLPVKVISPELLMDSLHTLDKRPLGLRDIWSPGWIGERSKVTVSSHIVRQQDSGVFSQCERGKRPDKLVSTFPNVHLNPLRVRLLTNHSASKKQTSPFSGPPAVLSLWIQLPGSILLSLFFLAFPS